MRRGARRTPRRLVLVAVGLLVASAPAGGGEPVSRAAAAERRDERVHVVKTGESLRTIAERYRLRVEVLVAANRLPGPKARLRPGQRLVIPRARAPLPRARRTTKVPSGMILSIPDFDGRLLAFEWPVEGTVISQFGHRLSGWHRGLDIKTEIGMPVLAAAPGVVVTSGVEYRYGNVVKIEHAESFMTVYAHHLQNFVTAGDVVRAGQVIGQIGRTGRASTYHLHFEIRCAGNVYNPLYLLPSPPRMTEVGDTGEEANDDE